MILQIFITDDDIKRFFESNGFEVEEREFFTWERAYHNKCEHVGRMQPAVAINGKYVEARKLVEKVTEKRMKRYLLPQSLEAKRMIESEFKTLLKVK